MSNETNLDTLKNLLSNKKALEESEVTTGSADERRWWPPYNVAPAPPSN